MIGFYLYVSVGLFLIYPRSTNQCMFNTDKERIRRDILEERNKAGSKYINIVCEKLETHEKEKLCNIAMKVLVAHERKRTTLVEGVVDVRRIPPLTFLNKPSTRSVPSLANMGRPFECRRIPIEGIDMEKRMYWCRSRAYSHTVRRMPGQTSGWNYDTTSDESDSENSDSDETDSDESSSDESSADDTDTKKANSMRPNSTMPTSAWNNSMMPKSAWNNSMKADSMTPNAGKLTSSSITTPIQSTAETETGDAEGFFITGSRAMPDTTFIFKPSPTNSQKVVIYAEMTWVSMLPDAYHRGRRSVALF